MDDYVILRDLSAGTGLNHFAPGGGSSLPFGTSLTANAASSRKPPEPDISVATMSSADLKDLVRDPSIAGIARVMPTNLIEPNSRTASVEAAAAGATWGVKAVGADTSPVDGAGVRVAVLDTGIDETHSAFSGMTLIQNDFTGSGNGDVNGHGTHVAGTVFGRDVGGLRIGVAPGVSEALIGKVLDDQGSGSSKMLFDAITWASESDAHVISMSLGFDFPGLTEQLIAAGYPTLLASSIALEGYRMNIGMFNALMRMIEARAAFNGGTVVVAASGNESSRDIDPNFEVSASLPSAAVGIVSVGALGTDAMGFSVAPFSNTNPTVSAPGVGVTSAATGGGLISFNGTSMAAPHVAGVAAHWWEKLSTSGIPLSADAVVSRLRANAVTNVFAAGQDILDRGEGLVQVPKV